MTGPSMLEEVLRSVGQVRKLLLCPPALVEAISERLAAEGLDGTVAVCGSRLVDDGQVLVMTDPGVMLGPAEASPTTWREPCPSCGGDVPEGTIWFVTPNLYCTEACARKAAGRHP